MIEKKRSPALRRRSPSPRHILGNRSLTDIDAELEKFSMNAGTAPERISEAHLADQPPDFARHLRPATSPRFSIGTDRARCQRRIVSFSGLLAMEVPTIEQHQDQPIAVKRSPFRTPLSLSV